MLNLPVAAAPQKLNNTVQRKRRLPEPFYRSGTIVNAASLWVPRVVNRRLTSLPVGTKSVSTRVPQRRTCIEMYTMD
jgi:hypothetical protein